MADGEYSINSAEKLMREFHALTMQILNLRLKALNLKRSWYEFMALYAISFAMAIVGVTWFFLSAGICLLWASSYHFIITKRIVKKLKRWAELDAMLALNISRLKQHKGVMDKLIEERDKYVSAIRRNFNSI